MKQFQIKTVVYFLQIYYYNYFDEMIELLNKCIKLNYEINEKAQFIKKNQI